MDRSGLGIVTENRIVLLGGGGHALDVTNAIERSFGPDSIAGYLDDRVSERMQAWSVPHLGGLGSADLSGRRIVLAIGFPASRQAVVARFAGQDFESVTVIDPDSTSGRNAVFGAGTVVLAGARISPNVCTGAHSFVGQNSVIGHDTLIGEHACVMPGANVSGDCVLGVGALIGTGSAVIQGLEIGDQAIVGAGAVVTRNVAAGETVIGSPARPRSK